MKRIRHDSPELERVALAWHGVWAAASLLSLLLSAGGVAWHLWAVKQHREALNGRV